MNFHPGAGQNENFGTSSGLDPIRRALLENEDWYRDLVEHSKDLLCVHDFSGRLLSINPLPARTLGYSVEELLRIPMRDLLAVEYRARFDDYLRDLKSAGEASGFLDVVTRTGQRRTWRYYSTLQNDANDLPVALSIAHDMTEQLQTEKMLRQATSRLSAEVLENEATIGKLGLFRTLVDHSNDPIEVVDPKTLRFVDANEKACSALGYSREELLSLGIFDINPAATSESTSQVQADLRQSGFRVMETLHRRKDGSTFPVEVSMRWVHLDQDYIVTVAHDLSTHKQAEDRLREYERVVEGLEEMIVVVDRDYRYVIANRAFLSYREMKREEVIGRRVDEVVYPEVFHSILKAKMDECFRGKVVAYSLKYTYPKLGERDLFATYFPIEGTSGVDRIAVILQDVTESRRAEEALRQSEERFRVALKNSPITVFHLDPELRYTWINNSQLTEAESPLLGKKLDAFFGTEEGERMERSRREVLETGIGRREETRALVDGNVHYYDSTIEPVLDESGSVVGLMGACMDITNRKHAEEALRRSEENYRMFISQSSEGIFRQDLPEPIPVDLPEDELVHRILHDSHMAECNQAMATMYGFTSSKEMLGKPLIEMLPPDDPHNVELTRDYIRSGFHLLDRESHEQDVHGNKKVFLNSLIGIVESGKLVRSWGIQRDVTEKMKLEEARQEADKALRTSEAHFRLLVEQASDGIFLADRTGKYLDVNSAGTEMLGYSKAEVLELSVADILASEELPRIAEEFSRFAGGNIARSEWTFRRKDGSFFSGEVVGRRLPDGRLQGILRDITERKQTEEALRQSEQRFRVALHRSPIKVFNQDRDLRYTWLYNPQEGWSEKDYLGKTDEEIFEPEMAVRLTQLKRSVLETGQRTQEEFALTARGKTQHCEVTIEPSFDGAGKIIGINGASVDVTRLREITEELRLAKEKLAEEKIYLEQAIDTELGFGEIVGHSGALKAVMENVARVAPCDATVLLLGETGTGKELVARALHRLSARKNNSFIKMNCAAIPSGLLESELFGHEKGAFTGAVAKKLGRLELADGGTLFLDEIGEIPLALQPKLLRVLQDQEFERLGGTQTLKVDFRLIAATNRDLLQSVNQRTFRNDLYYRLNVFPIRLPPLRDRREDIPELIEHFVRKCSDRMGKSITSIPARTMERLVQWAWPGNIRELENFVERSVILSRGAVLQVPLTELITSGGERDDPTLREKERERILHALRECNGQLGGPKGAAARLGLKRTTLQSKLVHLGIDPGAYRA
jgi:formate hydrogenlyase transcriptional activator